jgi:hypothetical protein
MHLPLEHQRIDHCADIVDDDIVSLGIDSTSQTWQLLGKVARSGA